MQRVKKIIHNIFFFLLGVSVTTLVLTLISYLVFVTYYKDRVFPGVKVDNLDLSNATREEILVRLGSKQITNLVINIQSQEATVSATNEELDLKLDTGLMISRAFSVGRQTPNPYYNFLQIIAAYQGQINLPLEISLDQKVLDQKLNNISQNIEKKPVDAVFELNPRAGPDHKDRVQTYSPSQNGIAIDHEKIYEELKNQVRTNLSLENKSSVLSVTLYTNILPPKIQTSTADKLGIKNLLGEGVSYFYDSIPGRLYNINLGTEKVSGSLIPPGAIFSFDEAIGTVSAVFGFQKAYAIIKGKTTLDDGGGVCQVSTTLYRAVLNAGLPVITRTPHTYRVGFYEQGGFLPGLDATVYPPDPDFKFKNDTAGWILIQTKYDGENKKLTFDLFGTSDNRKTEILGPFFISTSPPPEPVYEDDPTKPAGTLTQVDTAHAGAKVYFQRKVTLEDKILINETVYSDYIPWPARFLRGTKTG